jgi:hypothetical protein
MDTVETCAEFRLIGCTGTRFHAIYFSVARGEPRADRLPDQSSPATEYLSEIGSLQPAFIISYGLNKLCGQLNWRLESESFH